MIKSLDIKLLLIFILALVLRFLFFPNNVYFGYDQARDSYASLEILKGELKLIGPPSSFNENLFHGPLIYYIYAPIYYFSNLNPETVSFVFRVLNALGIFLVFGIGVALFNKNVGIIAALLFALSFEQTQYSLFLSHPSLAVLGVLLYYLGLSWLIFKRKSEGLILTFLGLGLAIQFHYVNLFLLLGLVSYLIIFRENLLISKKIVVLSLSTFFLIISSFIISEIKFNFRGVKALFEILSGITNPSISNSHIILSSTFNRMIQDNFTSSTIPIFSMILGILFIKFIFQKSSRSPLIFLGIWFTNGLIAYILSKSTSYYYNPGTSVSLIIFFSFLISLLFKKNVYLESVIIILIACNNFVLIKSQNKLGPNQDFVIQPQMLTVYEKKVLDYCYQNAQNEAFAINALTSPLFISTTWSYLFEWYGKETYKYLPVWGGKIASGFYNGLPTDSSRSDLPDKQCLIIEPTNGISEHDKNNFLREEDYFSKVEDEKKIGNFTVQFRKKF